MSISSSSRRSPSARATPAAPPAVASAQSIGRPTSTPRAPSASAIAMSDAAPNAAVDPDLRSARRRPRRPPPGRRSARDPVELAGAVVRDDDRVRSVLDRQHGILGGHDPLEHERQAGPRRGSSATSSQVRPTRRGAVAIGRSWSGEPGPPGRGRRRSCRAARRAEPVAPIAFADAEHRQVHRQHDRRVARRGGPLAQAAGEGAVAGRTAGTSGWRWARRPRPPRSTVDIVESVNGIPAAAAAAAMSTSAPGSASPWIAIGAIATGKARGRAEQRRREVDRRDVDEDARPEPVTLPGCRRSRPERLVPSRSTGDVVVRRGGHRVRRVPLELMEAHDPRQVGDRHTDGTRPSTLSSWPVMTSSSPSSNVSGATKKPASSSGRRSIRGGVARNSARRSRSRGDPPTSRIQARGVG